MKTRLSDLLRSKEGSAKRIAAIGVAFMLLNALVIGGLFVVATQRSLAKTLDFANETVAFLQNSCEKYDNYQMGKTSDEIEKLLGIANSFAHYMPSDQVEIDDSLIEEYVYSEHLSGMVVFDAEETPIAHHDADGRDPLVLWGDVLQSSSVQSVFRQHRSSYADMTSQRGIDFSVAVAPYEDGAVLVYRMEDEATATGYGYEISDLLANNTFHENPMVMIASKGSVVSSNDERANESLLRSLDDRKVDWSRDQLTKIEREGTTWYAVRSAYKDYMFYVLYPTSEVMSGRAGFVGLGCVAYLGIALAILVVRAVYDRRSLKETQKQLDIINAISTTYKTTFLVHLDTMKMEGINLSKDVERVFDESPAPLDFLDQVCRDVVLPECRDTLKEFMDLATLEERLRDVPFLGLDIQNSHGVWYSIQVIPQRRDEDGRLLAVLVATRDITTIKRAEELSFLAKPTGLHNRNYLESHEGELLSYDNLPVSVVMADCNYLKRTNDTLGHEWGDRLLQRMAAVLREVAGDECLPMRVGGDEFLLVCPHTDGQQTESLVVMMRDGLDMVSDEVLQVSASFGVCTVEDAYTTMSEAFKKADEKMYVEKRAVHAARDAKE